MAARHPAAGLIHHSDQGVPYASTADVQRLEAMGAQVSMSAKGHPSANAKAESFFKTLKKEEVYLKEDASFAEAQRNLAAFSEDVDNAKRLHSSLGDVPPNEFETTYRLQKVTTQVVRSLGFTPVAIHLMNPHLEDSLSLKRLLVLMTPLPNQERSLELPG